LFTFDDFVSREQYLRSAFYNEWCRPQGIDATLAANVLLDGTVSAVAAVYRPWSRGGDFDRREQAIFSALTPHLQRAVRIHVRMSQPNRERANWLEILDRLRQAVLIVDADARVLFANGSAEALLAKGDGLRVALVRKSDRGRGTVTGEAVRRRAATRAYRAWSSC
jgi:hypothetical protein